MIEYRYVAKSQQSHIIRLSDIEDIRGLAIETTSAEARKRDTQTHIIKNFQVLQGNFFKPDEPNYDLTDKNVYILWIK
ncbi:MAG: hypothetical protein JJU13_18765 [Balneolaceae bacterium]|nr:hypothetical protein [Balneolaceae bacterium]